MFNCPEIFAPKHLPHLLQLFRNDTHFQGWKGWKGEVGEQGTSVRTILARHNDHSLCYFFHLATFASTCIPLKSELFFIKFYIYLLLEFFN